MQHLTHKSIKVGELRLKASYSYHWSMCSPQPTEVFQFIQNVTWVDFPGSKITGICVTLCPTYWMNFWVNITEAPSGKEMLWAHKNTTLTEEEKFPVPLCFSGTHTFNDPQIGCIVLVSTATMDILGQPSVDVKTSSHWRNVFESNSMKAWICHWQIDHNHNLAGYTLHRMK